MEWINKYWKVITTLVLLVLAAGALQAQVASNSANIVANKDALDKADESIASLVQKETDEIKKKIDKESQDAKSEREAIKAKQEKTTTLEVKVEYIQRDIKSNKDVLDQILQEMRKKP